MKSLCLLICLAALLCLNTLPAETLPPAALQGVHTVYLFPMRNAMDQYLASRITEQHLFRVVEDPKLADAFMTDKVGPVFEEDFNKRVLDIKPPANEQNVHTAFATGSGTLYLVSKSKEIIWSVYDPPKDKTPKQLDRTAKRTVDRLMKQLYPKPASGS